MRWSRSARGNAQIEDRRGRGGRAIGVGAGGISIIGILLALLFGGDVFGGGGSGVDVGFEPFPGMPEAQAGGGSLDGAPDPDAELRDFVGFLVDNVQQSWDVQFEQAGLAYEPTTLVLFEDATSSGCGPASSATGPFYCPLDQKVYLDLGFFRQLQSRFGAPGDFAQAYVVAHEFGHHVQNVLAVSDRVRELQQSDPDQANELSVRLELQADCFAGVWAHSAYEQDRLVEGDLEEGLAAAAAVGDDRIQSQATGRVNPEVWTHGSSQQRTTWFSNGFESGDPNTCDTFSGNV